MCVRSTVRTGKSLELLKKDSPVQWASPKQGVRPRDGGTSIQRSRRPNTSNKDNNMLWTYSKAGRKGPPINESWLESKYPGERSE